MKKEVLICLFSFIFCVAALNAKENQNAENGAVKHAKEMLKQQPKPKGPAM